jgi:hypothetical protein
MSGFKVNFSVNNQLATPSMHAAALANRPAAGQPGRVFIDTDNPSTGIYRDTGTIWIQIGAGAGALNLQNVTDNGNSTTNNILLQYPDNAQDNALVFYNSDLAQEEYLIRKRATGILTNDVLSIESKGNISPSTNPVGILIDGSQDLIRSFFANTYSEIGLKLDFAVFNFFLGDFGNSNNGTLLSIDDNNSIIKSSYQQNDIGLKLDFANSNYWLGDFNNINNGGAIVVNVGAPEIYTKFNIGNLGYNITQSNIVLGDYGSTYNGLVLKVDFDGSGPEIIYTQYGGTDVGLYLDFVNIFYALGYADGGDFVNTITGIKVDAANQKIIVGDTWSTNNYCYWDINFDSLGVNQGIKSVYQGNSIGLKLDFANDIYTLGSNTEYIGIDPTNNTLIAGANLLSGTAGGSSGQHLKININGTNYKIKLENP